MYLVPYRHTTPRKPKRDSGGIDLVGEFLSTKKVEQSHIVGEV